jgi:D-alanyl-lipoteichoic acid acyltransferase DltB (MBOAT superfamily)
MFRNIRLEKITELLSFNQNDPLVFSTSLFLILFLGFLLVYNLVSKYKNARIFLLILFSIYFYYKAAGYYTGILIISAIINFYFGKWIALTENFNRKKLFLIFALIVNLGILGYFKYTNFIFQIFADISNKQIDPLAIFLPIGISFYTFKSLTYVFDIYYDTLKPTNSLRNFSLYVFYFPNILMGPIDRASAFLPQIDQEPFISKEDIGRATFLIIAGLIKKVVIADYISLNFVDRVFDFPLRFTGVENLLAIYGYTLQIYCDFSGYTDMAIGVSLLLGFKLMDNFNSPFKATSIADFWRRWHISLSKWLLNYLFKPLQFQFRSMKMFGNMLALLITFFICGLWHGAGWNFIIWGALHGFMMSFALLIQKPKLKFYNFLKINNTKPLKLFQTIITFHLIVLSFLIFRAHNLQSVADMLSQVVQFFHGEVFMQFVEKLPIIFFLILLGYLFHFMPISIDKLIQKSVFSLPLFAKAILIALVIWVAVQFKSADIMPFIYFQF